VAAGTLLPEGMQMPPGSLVMGSPGKVRRALTDAEESRPSASMPSRYVAYRLDYMQA
jgi:carbonic anhydrase/acetyltransferase-like protein (isoleucine patch superfamily)